MEVNDFEILFNDVTFFSKAYIQWANKKRKSEYNRDRGLKGWLNWLIR